MSTHYLLQEVRQIRQVRQVRQVKDHYSDTTIIVLSCWPAALCPLGLP